MKLYSKKDSLKIALAYRYLKATKWLRWRVFVMKRKMLKARYRLLRKLGLWPTW